MIFQNKRSQRTKWTGPTVFNLRTWTHDVTNMHITLHVLYTHAVAQIKVSRSNATCSLQRGSRRRATQLSSEWTRRGGHTSQHHASLDDLAMETARTSVSSSGCVRLKHHISTIKVQLCDLTQCPKYRIGITETNNPALGFWHKANTDKKIKISSSVPSMFLFSFCLFNRQDQQLTWNKRKQGWSQIWILRQSLTRVTAAIKTQKTILILRMSSCIIISGIYSNIGYAVKSHLQCCLHNMLTTAGTNCSHENLENNPTLF